MTLVNCFATPHPPVMVPQVGRDRLGEVGKTVAAMQRLGEETRSLAPEVVVLMSPHAPLTADKMGVSFAEWHEGSFALFGAPEVSLRLLGVRDLAEDVAAECEARAVPVRRLHERRGAELDHGTLSPLAMLLEHVSPPPALLVLSFSYLGVEAHVEFGRAVGAVVRADPRRILYVASGDLSHRLIPGAPAGFSPRGAEFDAAVAAAFEADDLAALRSLPGDLVQAAGECGLRSLITLSGVIEGVEHRTRLLSYEGPFGVGYLVGAVDVIDPVSNEAALEEAVAAAPGPADDSAAGDTDDDDPVVALARRAVEAVVMDGRKIDPGTLEAGPDQAGVFVSLHLPDGSLRGCIGTFAATTPTLSEEIVNSAIGAATRDPRFLPVRPEELRGLRVAVDVLEEPEDVEGLEQLDPRVYGVIVRTDDGRQALLLPDLEGVDTAERQVSIACHKGHIDPMSDRYRLQRFLVSRHGRH